MWHAMPDMRPYAVQRFDSHSGTRVQVGLALTLSKTRRAATADITLVIGSKAHTTDNKVSGDVKCVVVDRSILTVTHPLLCGLMSSPLPGGVRRAAARICG
jgi:hypothetical protein